MDWVPVFNYGGAWSLPGGSGWQEEHFPLMDPSLFDQTLAQSEVVGRVDDSPSDWFIHRIVGQYSVSWQASGEAPAPEYVVLRVWPGFIDDVGFAVTPGDLRSGVSANSRFWWDRRQTVESTRIGAGGVPEAPVEWLSDSDPFWSHIDIRPKQLCRDNLIPLLSVGHGNADPLETFYIRLYWRMLVTPVRRGA